MDSGFNMIGPWKCTGMTFERHVRLIVSSSRQEFFQENPKNVTSECRASLQLPYSVNKSAAQANVSLEMESASDNKR